MDASDEIITALGKCNYRQLSQIREAVEQRSEAIKAEFMAQAEAMGLACHDDNGKPKRKRRANAHKEPE